MFDIVQELCKATQMAAISAFSLVGGGDNFAADKYTTDTLRKYLNKIHMDGKIVIGEGERDDAPMLFIGEKLGTGTGVRIDIAVDPLEGTKLCSEYRDGAMSVLVAADHNSISVTPDIYMTKLAVNGKVPRNVVSLENSVKTNILNLAEARGSKPNQLTVIILKRERHIGLISEVRETGAKVKLIDDGDIWAVLSVMKGEYDMYIGIGGAPEGIISSTIAKNLNGQIYCKFVPDKDRKKHFSPESFYNLDYDRIYTQNDMVKGKALFIATGVTDCEIMKGVSLSENHITTETVLISEYEETLIKKTIKKENVEWD